MLKASRFFDFCYDDFQNKYSGRTWCTVTLSFGCLWLAKEALPSVSAFTRPFLWCLTLAGLTLHVSSLWISLFIQLPLFMKLVAVWQLWNSCLALKLGWKQPTNSKVIRDACSCTPWSYICSIFERSQAEKIKSDLIRDRCIITFHELEKN